MKRILFVAVLVVVLIAVGAVAAFAAPGGPGRGFGMMGGAQGAPYGYGMMGGAQGAPYGYGMMGGAQGAPYGYGMMGGAQGAPYGHMGDGMMDDDLEELLGIDHADIYAARVAGKSLVDLAAEKGVTEDQLIQKLLDGRQAALDQAVTAGNLTQAAADQMLAFMKTNIKTMVEAKGVGGAQGVPGGMMRGSGVGPCYGGQAPAQQDAPAGQGGVRNNMRLAPWWSQQG